MSDLMPNDIVSIAKKLQRAAEAMDNRALKQLIDGYGAMYKRLLPRIDALTLKLSSLENPTQYQIRQLAQYKELILEINKELTRFQSYAGVVMQTSSEEAIKTGILNAKTLTYAGYPAVIARWNTLNPNVIETLLGYFSDGSALMKRLDNLAGTNALKVSQTILDSVALGKNPKVIAGLIQNSLGGGLTDALRMCRTVQLYSYREANRLSYKANSDVVRGWYWMSALDANSCMSCIVMHGTFHTNDETLNDHHNGLCTMLPAVIGAPNPLGSDMAGHDWFNGLSLDEQKLYMGAGKFEAWQAGKFDLSQLSSMRSDDVYGDMRIETALKDLIGE